MGRIEGEASEVVEAPIARVFEVAADVEGSPQWQPGIKSAQCVERDADGRQVVVDTVSDGKVRDLKSRLRFFYDEPAGLSWEQQDGDLSAVEGRWSFEEVGEGSTRATYWLSVDLGRMLGMLIRGPVVDVLRRQMVDTMPGKLKGFVEGE
jgi:ribosome-associated toxin RatA of RatAB toxin-antitoxin module